MPSVDEQQLELFREEGGLLTGNAERDPVSGNEVPPGSRPEEVRDDVPAMLSENEYIVPADVVRYYGVKFFEDLRGQAKSGLMDMERNGRIGGEPVDAPMAGGDLTPEEMAMLSQITGMYAGGDVRSGYQTGGMVASGMTEGDFNNEATQAGGFRLPSSIFTPTPPTAPVFTPVTLYGPTGDTMLASTKEQYDQLIAQGYTTSPRVTPVTPTASGDDSGGGDLDDLEAAGGGFKLNDENLESLLSDPFKFGTDALGDEPMFSSRQMAGAGSMLGGMPGMLAGGLAGAAMELDNIGKARASLELARARGLEGTEQFTTLSNSIDEAVNNLSGPAKLLERLGLGSGKSYLNQATEAGITPTTAPVTTVASTGGGGGGSDNRTPTVTPESDRSPQAPATSSRPTARPDSSQLSSAGQASKAAAEKANEKAKAEAQLSDIQSGKKTTGRVGFEGGGLVAKPTRKKPVAEKK